MTANEKSLNLRQTRSTSDVDEEMAKDWSLSEADKQEIGVPKELRQRAYPKTQAVKDRERFADQSRV